MKLDKIFPWFFGFVFLLIVAQLIAYAYVGLTAVKAIETNCADGMAKCAGRVYKDFKDGSEGK